MHTRRLALLLRLCLAAALLAAQLGCERQAALPKDPGLAQDPLGVAISLGQDSAGATTAANSSAGRVAVMSREELLNHNPYSEHDTTQDLILAVTVSAGIGPESVKELRAYLADAEHSKLKLLGRPAAQLTAESAVTEFGEPARRSSDSDGAVHVEWAFAAPDRKQGPIQLTISFAPTGECFALAIRQSEKGK